MVVGVVSEIKQSERRVALTPAGAHELTAHGAQVLVQSGAGDGSGFSDDDYTRAGASLIPGAETVWGESELILKVKEPIESEYGYLRENLALFTYLHLAPNRPLTRALIESGITAIALETVSDASGGLPLLAPMSEIAGRLATQAGAYFLQEPQGGNGTLIGGAPGVRPASVVVVGGGAVGTHAARVAVGMGARVTILERSLSRIHHLEEYFSGRATVLMSDRLTLEELLPSTDLLIGAVLIPGAATPKLIGRDALALMRPRTVMVDVAIDQGGFAETSRPTTHSDPVYVEGGVLHYCVANMPGAVPVTSTRALTNATLPYVLKLAGQGVDEAFAHDAGLAQGLNVRAGKIHNEAVAEAYGETLAAA